MIAHVAEFYHGQPQYHEGWTNRYKQEKELCLSLLPEKPTVPPVEQEPPAAGFPCGSAGSGTPLPRKAAEMRLPGETKPPESVLPPEDEPAGAPEGNPPSAPNEPAPPANDGAGQADPDETPKPDGDSAAPTPPASPSNPENTTPPAGSETTPPEETKPPESTTPPESPETTPGLGLQEPTKEVANSSKPSLEEPTAPAQEPVNLPKADGDEKNGNETAAKTSKLSQTGDGTTNAPLGVALGAPGIAAIAGAALATRRILK